jgi:hypothetical protein
VRKGALDQEEELSGPGMGMILGPAVVSPAFVCEQILKKYELFNFGNCSGAPPIRVLLEDLPNPNALFGNSFPPHEVAMVDSSTFRELH